MKDFFSYPADVLAMLRLKIKHH